MKVIAGENTYEIRLTRVSFSEMTDDEVLAWVEKNAGPRSMTPQKERKQRDPNAPPTKKREPKIEKEFDPSALG